jgi:hypothetical protein
MGEVSFSETSVSIYRTARYNAPEDSSFQKVSFLEYLHWQKDHAKFNENPVSHSPFIMCVWVDIITVDDVISPCR